MKFCSLSLLISSVTLFNDAMAFVPSHQHQRPVSTFTASLISTSTNLLSSSLSATEEETPNPVEIDMNSQITVPMSLNEMINQVSSSIRDASSSESSSSTTITRQIIRIMLPRDSKSGQLGQYYENEILEDLPDLESITLVPPDETWQGGIMQLYRAISIPAKLILRDLGGTVGGVPPTIVEDRSIDSSQVDGVGILQSQVPNNPSKDICCFIQPLQETVDSIESISDQAGQSRLVLLLNPQWRNIDDALDTVSKQGGFMGNVASFLGGKGNSLKRLDNMGFESVYTIEGYVCKGGNVRLMKRFDSDWIVFAENDSETDYIRIGDMKTRPTYQDVEEMLDAKGISLKYARDIGLAPKLE